MISTSECAIRHSALLHRQVIDAVSMQPLGQVSDLWIDLRQHRVMGFSSCKGFWGTGPRMYAWAEVETVTPEQIAVQSTPSIHSSLIRHINSETGMAVKMPLALGVWSQQGEWVGKITDFCFDADTGAIDAYFCVPHQKSGQAQHLLNLSPSMFADEGQGCLLLSEQVMLQADLDKDVWELLPLLATFAS